MATRLIVAALIVALLNACATPRMVRLDTGQGAPLEYRPLTALLLIYLGVETFLEVVDASRELKWATGRATI